MTNEEMIKLLNEDMRHEIEAALTYLHQHATASGFQGEQLRAFLAPEIPGELQHAILLADKIVALGGNPDVGAIDIQTQTTVKEMLEHDLDLEKQAIADYKLRAEQADELGDVALKVRMEELAAEEADHRQAIERFLRGLGS
ncbi:MAG: ferritin-like domain-containing protein [Actinomycetota bacterium]